MALGPMKPTDSLHLEIFRELYFQECDTGGGCTALRYDFDNVNNSGDHILITDCDASAPGLLCAEFVAIRYNAEAEPLAQSDGTTLTNVLTFLRAQLPTDMVAEAIGTAFAMTLERWLSPAEWQRMREANRAHKDDGICASHDFCDANMAMLEAFQLFGLDAPDADDETAAALWNASWEYAKTEHLTAA